MSENEFDVQRDRAEDERDNVVLTGEEIELPGEDSDASAIIGESSEPIHTGEIESVAVGSLTARVPAAAPLKPAIEDRISTGELPIVAAAGALPAVSSGDEADSAPGSEDPSADADSATPVGDASAEQEATPEASSAEPAEAAPETAPESAPAAEPADTTPEAAPEASSTEPADTAPEAAPEA